MASGGVGQGQVTVRALRIAALRRAGTSWRAIADELGVGEGTVRRANNSCFWRGQTDAQDRAVYPPN